MRFGYEFYEMDVLKLAPALLGQYLVHVSPEGKVNKFIITNRGLSWGRRPGMPCQQGKDAKDGNNV